MTHITRTDGIEPYFRGGDKTRLVTVAAGARARAFYQGLRKVVKKVPGIQRAGTGLFGRWRRYARMIIFGSSVGVWFTIEADQAFARS